MNTFKKRELMTKTTCKICSHEAIYIFNSTILNKYEISYFHCPNCNFLFTEKPYWLEEAYNETINKSDTGILKRNIELAKKTSRVLFYLFDYKKSYLDFGGGYGLFVRLMRDNGIDFFWDDAYTRNLLARGFEYTNEPIELITTFETFEHFENPIKEIEKMLKISPNILFTTDLYPNPIPRPENWWYYALDHGQHISFYSIDTLKYIAAKYNLNLYSNGKYFHLLTSKKINNYLFKTLLLNRLNYISDKWMKYNLKSKTWSDHLNLKRVSL